MPEPVEPVDENGKRTEALKVGPMNTCAERLSRMSVRAIFWPLFAVLPIVIGCGDSISIAPSCPNSLNVGETGQVFAQVINPGSIPTYYWEAIPASAGVFTNPAIADTTFQALEEGMVTIRLTATDGLFAVISECQINVSGILGLAVSLEADPVLIVVGETVTLTCESVGETVARELSISQSEGPIVELVNVEPGVVRFEPQSADEYVFRCVGAGRDAQLSPPALATVTVFLDDPPPSDGNENVNDNPDENENTNDNVPDNTNDNEANADGG